MKKPYRLLLVGALFLGHLSWAQSKVPHASATHANPRLPLKPQFAPTPAPLPIPVLPENASLVDRLKAYGTAASELKNKNQLRQANTLLRLGLQNILDSYPQNKSSLFYTATERAARLADDLADDIVSEAAKWEVIYQYYAAIGWYTSSPSAYYWFQFSWFAKTFPYRNGETGPVRTKYSVRVWVSLLRALAIPAAEDLKNEGQNPHAIDSAGSLCRHLARVYTDDSAFYNPDLDLTDDLEIVSQLIEGIRSH